MAAKKKTNSKTAQIKARSKKMSVISPCRKRRGARLVLSCTEQEKQYVKTRAADEGKTISQFLLEFVHAQPYYDYRSHEPNEETARVLKETEQGMYLESHDSLEDFWKSMGMDPHAKD